MKTALRLLASLIILTLGGREAVADVRYDFAATSSVAFQGLTYSGSFSVQVPDFITSDATFPVTSLSSCSAMSSAGPVECIMQSFFVNVVVGYETIGFGVLAPTVPPESPNLQLYYYFPDGAFSAPGTYSAEVHGMSQPATLTVSVVPDISTATSALLGLLFLGRFFTSKARAQLRASAEA